MQGTGKQTDPYIPGNWEEFVTAIGTKNADVSLPEGGGTFNMNEIAPTGVGIITANCEEINGNGWMIESPYNMTLNADSSGRKNIYNLNILNFLDERGSFYDCLIRSSTYDPLYFYNCQFSGNKVSLDESESGTAVFLNRVYLTSCGINISFGGNVHRLFKHFYDYSSWGYFCNVQLDYTGCTADFSISSYRGGNAYAFDNSFLRIRTNPDKTQKTAFYSGSVNDIALIDSKNIVLDSTGESHEVTDAQLRDAAYLNSIGFPIAAEG